MQETAGHAPVDGEEPADGPPGVVLYGLRRRAAVYAVVGALNTVLYFALYNSLRVVLEPLAANSVAVAASITFSFWANRRFTFQQAGRERVMRQFVEFAVMFGATLLVSNAALLAVFALRPDPGRLEENAALILSSAALVVARFWVMHTWIFRADRHQAAAG